MDSVHAKSHVQDGISGTGAFLTIFDSGGLRVQSLGSSDQWQIGRYAGTISGPGVIPLQSPIVSRNHGALLKDRHGWCYVDNPDNTNGTLYNGVKLPRQAPGCRALPQRYLSDGDVLRIDSTTSNNPDAVLLVFSESSANTAWQSLDLANRGTVCLGRAPDCDVVLPQPYISGYHACIHRQNGKFWLSDKKSRAGTYLNRQRITSEVCLQERDCFVLCDQIFIFSHGVLYYLSSARRNAGIALPPSAQRPVVLKADIRTKKVRSNKGSGTQELIRDIQLNIREGSLVAMLGTAGAGKSTVMNCLNGMDLHGVEGSVIYRNTDLLRHFDQIKELIGSVPQQKVFHPTFTPEQEFRFAARKRLPGDTTDAEIKKRVDDTLSMLSIQGVRNSRNCKLSGGEQTRVNIGIELVADRELLCLDEPDQGLSPNYKHELFLILRDLAHKQGKCVLCIIHDVSEIDLFDQVIMLAKKDGVGRLAFSGTPKMAKEYFGVDIRDAYSILDKNPERFIR